MDKSIFPLLSQSAQTSWLSKWRAVAPAVVGGVPISLLYEAYLSLGHFTGKPIATGSSLRTALSFLKAQAQMQTKSF